MGDPILSQKVPPSERGIDTSTIKNREVSVQNPVDVVLNAAKFEGGMMNTPPWQTVKEARTMVDTLDDPQQRASLEESLAFFEKSYEDQFQNAIGQLDKLGTSEFSGLSDADVQLLKERSSELHPSFVEKIDAAAHESTVLKEQKRAARKEEAARINDLKIEAARNHVQHVEAHPEGQFEIADINKHRERNNTPTVMMDTLPSDTTLPKKGFFGKIREAVGL